MKSLLRTPRFNTGAQLVLLYKAQLLSFIEYRTPAIYHACCSALENLDLVQSKLLEAAGMTDLEALNHCRLAPLSTRRDIALLGLIHRTVLGKGPNHFRNFFPGRRDGTRRRAWATSHAIGGVYRGALF